MMVAQVTGIAACPRGLRHGFGVGTLQAGVPINLTQRWMGHSRLSTTAIYADPAVPRRSHSRKDSGNYRIMPVSPCGPIDQLIGANVRHFRKEARLTQSALAERLNLTFQQLQKYELRKNRIAALRLFHISQILDVPIEYFFSDQLKLTNGPKVGAVASTGMIRTASAIAADGDSD